MLLFSHHYRFPENSLLKENKNVKFAIHFIHFLPFLSLFVCLVGWGESGCFQSGFFFVRAGALLVKISSTCIIFVHRQKRKPVII